MSRKRFPAKQIIGKLREAEVGLAQEQTVGQVFRTLGVAEQTFYRWRPEYGGLKIEQAKRLKALEQENARHQFIEVAQQHQRPRAMGIVPPQLRPGNGIAVIFNADDVARQVEGQQPGCAAVENLAELLERPHRLEPFRGALPGQSLDPFLAGAGKNQILGRQQERRARPGPQ